jgi:hypothetical protein
MRHWRPLHGWNDRVLMPSVVADRFGAEPKPCPFCRSKTVGLWTGPTPHMTCGNCGADGPAFEGTSNSLEHRQQQAFDAWQAAKRGDEDASPRRI